MSRQCSSWYRTRNTDLAREIKHQNPVTPLPDVHSMPSPQHCRAYSTAVLAIKQSIWNLRETLWKQKTGEKTELPSVTQLKVFINTSMRLLTLQKWQTKRNGFILSLIPQWGPNSAFSYQFISLLQSNITATFLRVSLLMPTESHCPSECDRCKSSAPAKTNEFFRQTLQERFS